MAPFDLTAQLGHVGASVLYGAIGFAFGFILESAGFGDSRRLAAQFYWRDLAVLKVMFTAIVVAALLVFWATALGWLDYDEVWVNPTYLWPGILGGLIMGVGFILGGFCPGTSLVGLATLKLDAAWFVAGSAVGIFGFGETVDRYTAFWHSGDYGRLTLQEWLGLPAGLVVVGIVGVAIVAFWLGDMLRRRLYGEGDER
jgi:hypothetical protein